MKFKSSLTADNYIIDLTNKNSNLQSEYDKLIVLNNDLLAKINGLNDQMSDFSKNKSDLLELKKELSTNRQNQQSRNKSLSDQISELTKCKSDLEKQLFDQRKLLDENNAELIKRISEQAKYIEMVDDLNEKNKKLADDHLNLDILSSKK